MPQSTFLPLLTRFVEKLRTLMLPLTPMATTSDDGGGPLSAEVCAAVSLMEWMLGYLDRLKGQLGDDARAWRMLLPNAQELGTVISSLSNLTCPMISLGESAVANLASTTPRDESLATDFVSKKALLIEQLTSLQPYVVGYKRPDNIAQAHFLPNMNQRLAYKDYLLAYYHEYMLSGQGKHKDDMLHWAAIYQVIVDRGGVVLPRGVSKIDAPFYGPEFDYFIFDFCGIRYNASSNARGRYRRVGEVREACLHPDPNSPKALSPKLIELYKLYYSQMSNLIYDRDASLSSRSDVSCSSHSGHLGSAVSRHLFGSSDVPQWHEQADA